LHLLPQHSRPVAAWVVPFSTPDTQAIPPAMASSICRIHSLRLLLAFPPDLRHRSEGTVVHRASHTKATAQQAAPDIRLSNHLIPTAHPVHIPLAHIHQVHTNL